MADSDGIDPKALAKQAMMAPAGAISAVPSLALPKSAYAIAAPVAAKTAVVAPFVAPKSTYIAAAAPAAKPFLPGVTVPAGSYQPLDLGALAGRYGDLDLDAITGGNQRFFAKQAVWLGMPEPLTSRKSAKPCCEECGKADALGEPMPCAEQGARRTQALEIGSPTSVVDSGSLASMLRAQWSGRFPASPPVGIGSATPLTLQLPLQNIVCNSGIMSAAEYAELETYRQAMIPFFLRDHFYRNSPQSCDVLDQDLTQPGIDAWNQAVTFGVYDDTDTMLLGPSAAWQAIIRRIGARPGFPTIGEVEQVTIYFVNRTRGAVEDITCDRPAGVTHYNQVAMNVPLVKPLPPDFPSSCYPVPWIPPQQARQLRPTGLLAPVLFVPAPVCHERELTFEESSDLCTALGLAADAATHDVPFLDDRLAAASFALVQARNGAWAGAFAFRFAGSCAAFLEGCNCSSPGIALRAAAFVPTTLGGVGPQLGKEPGRCLPTGGIRACCTT